VKSEALGESMGEFKLHFSGIGVAKAGTSWIARCLGEHPSVCMARGKETNFFLRKHIASSLPVRRFQYGTSHYDEGLEWYKGKFSHHRDGQLYGEFSNAYLADPESAGLLFAHNPEMKLLCCFRSPVEATYAGYHQLSRVQPLPDTFEEMLERYPQMLEYARYHHNLQPFLKLFPRERFHLMLFEDIKTDPVALYQGICRFLGIDPSFVPQAVNQRVNPRTVLRSRALRNLRCAIADLMSSTPVTRKLRAGLVKMGAARAALKLVHLNERPGKVPPMAPDTRRRLVELYRKDTEALGELLQRDLSHWNQ
jgi:Sulfotransferase domain